MNELMIESQHKVLNYVMSPYAGTSYLVSDIESCLEFADRKERNRSMKEERKRIKYFFLPSLLSITKGESMPDVSQTGRGTLKRTAQLKGHFTNEELSPYKKHDPFKLNTSLWPIDGHPSFFYGTIGITGPSGEITEDNKDLLIVETSDWKQLKLHVFFGMAIPEKCMEYMKAAVSMLEAKNEKGNVFHNTLPYNV